MAALPDRGSLQDQLARVSRDLLASARAGVGSLGGLAGSLSGTVTGWKQGYTGPQAVFYERAIADAAVRTVLPELEPALDAVPDGGLVVDIGTGAGHLLDAIRRRRPDLHLVGVEPSGTLLAAARRRLGNDPSVRLVQAGVDDLPNDVRGADLVVSTFAYKHWPAPLEGLRRCEEALRPGGQLVVTEIDGTADLRRWSGFVAATPMPALLQKAYATATLKPIVGRAARPDELRDALVAAGLTDVEVRSMPHAAVLVATGRRHS